MVGCVISDDTLNTNKVSGRFGWFVLFFDCYRGTCFRNLLCH